MPRVTVITICYRNPADLEQTLNSLSPLDPELFERLVIDGSPDTVCERISARFEHVRHLRGKDSGKYDAMNKGIAQAQGELLLFMNSGDLLVSAGQLSATLAGQADIATDTLFYGDAIFDIDDVAMLVPAPALSPDTIAKGILPSHQAILIPTAFHRVHLYDAKMHFAADTKLLRQAFSALPARYLPFPIARFAYGGVSNSPGSWRSISRQLHELREAHDLTLRETAAEIVRLVRRKLLQRLFGETWFRRVQRERLVSSGRAQLLEASQLSAIPPYHPGA